MSFIIILTFLTLIVMLLVRVIALIFLLILSPIVWLLWIFPATKKYWTQWWQEFIRWNFFAPAIMFFMYLAVLTQNNVGALLNNTSKAKEALAANTLLPDTIWGLMMNNIVVLAFLVGGIYVANKFGIAGGDIGVNMAKKTGKGVGAWAGRKTWGGIKGGAMGGYNRIAEKAGWRDKSKEAFQKATESTGWRKMLYGIQARTYANLSAPTERAPKKYEGEVKGMTTTQLQAALPTTVLDAKKATILKELAGRPDIPLKGKARRDYFAKAGVNEETKKIFKDRYGMDFSEIEKKSGMSAEMGTAINKKDTGGFVAALSNFTKSLKKKDGGDFGKAIKDVFKKPIGIRDHDEITMAEYYADAMAKNNPAVASAVIPHMDFETVVNFQKDMNGAFNRWSDAEPGKREEIVKRIKSFDSAISNHMSSIWGAGEEKEEKKGEKGAEPKSEEGKNLK